MAIQLSAMKNNALKLFHWLSCNAIALYVCVCRDDDDCMSNCLCELFYLNSHSAKFSIISIIGHLPKRQRKGKKKQEK